MVDFNIRQTITTYYSLKEKGEKNIEPTRGFSLDLAGESLHGVMWFSGEYKLLYMNHKLS